MKIAFAGYGIEAESAYKYYKKRFPGAEFVVYDANASTKKPLPENVVFNGNVKDFLNIDADVVVRTPAINPSKISTTGTLTSVTKEFFLQCKLPIIGVTGTKGKGTTSTLIAKILERAGIKVWTVGNIGVPALDILDDVNAADEGVVVYEASSFQLWDLQQSPHVAVVLTIEPEHLDVHESFEDYIQAKANIARYQSHDDTIIFYENNENSQNVAANSVGKKKAYSGNIIENGMVMFNDEPLLKVSDLGLKGEHNLQNIHAALIAASEFTNDLHAMANAVRDFKGLPHRIEEVGKRDGVLFVNDSFSSAPPATIAAVRSYDLPIHLIMGGYDRGIDLEPLVDELTKEQHLKNVYLIGQTAPLLHDLFTQKGFTDAVIYDSLERAFIEARKSSTVGEVVLLSPGCASFDMFKDFTARGEAFMSLVAREQREFIFEGYEFNESSHEATFRYSFDEYDYFIERVVFGDVAGYDAEMLDRALRLAFFVIGTSYYKLYPGSRVRFKDIALDEWQAQFMDAVYQEGMSQFAYENELSREELAHFVSNRGNAESNKAYSGRGILSLQSGGKDSLLTAVMLTAATKDFDSLYVTSHGGHYPQFINDIPGRLYTAERIIDLPGLKKHIQKGGLNGHIPVTYVVMSIALVQAILLNKNTVVASIGHEGEEPHEWIGDLAITHQWSKTWHAEQLFAEYVNKYISADIHVGSPLRRFTELKIAELFALKAWDTYGHLFSSCNVANYGQGNDNSQLHWCGDCPKCANSYILFAPFLPAQELQSLFGGQDLFLKPNLVHTFEGLLGIGDAMKPFECVGEVDELRYAYHRAQQQGGYAALPFPVPESRFDYEQLYPAQSWATSLF